MKDQPGEFTGLGILGSIGGAILLLWAVIKAVQKLCLSLLKALRVVLQFSDAVPAVLKLPETQEAQNNVLVEQNRVLAEQSAALVDIKKDLHELKKGREPRVQT